MAKYAYNPMLSATGSKQNELSSEDFDSFNSLDRILSSILIELKDKPAVFVTLKEFLEHCQDVQDVKTLRGDIHQSIQVATNWTVIQARQPCPVHSPELIGALGSNQVNIQIDQLHKLYRMVQDGGHHAPPHCTPSEKVAIIIPYRNRLSHLHILLNNLFPVIIRQQLDFTIFVIEQSLTDPFNRGMLFNIGYLEALKLSGNFTCFIFHDVDMLPLDDHCLYKCADHPKHLTVSVSKWKYELPYPDYFGGVVAFTSEQFHSINGASTLFFGWGGEDDDLLMRVVLSGYKTLRYPKHIGRYDMIRHGPDVGNKPNPLRSKLLQSTQMRQHVEGLNTTKYKVNQIQKKQLYTWITVTLNMTEVIQVAPDAIRGDLVELESQLL
ncbi:hypothetical protein Btru_009820 [Bulinus truncatus]|nr:hypothetical protein Btru_009820 [Bulinus truncatus]